MSAPEPSTAKSLSDCDSAYHDPAAPVVCENAADSDGVTAVKQHDMRSRFVDIVELLLEALLFYEHLESLSLSPRPGADYRF